MKKRLFSLALAAILVVGLCTACGSNKVYTQEQAQKLALKDAGITADEATDIHAHLVTENGIPCYSIHIYTSETTYSYVIAAKGGEILSSDKGVDLHG